MKRGPWCIALLPLFSACFSSPDYHEGGRSTQLPLPTDGGVQEDASIDSGIDANVPFDAGFDSGFVIRDSGGGG